jgi:hypothetical protein
VQGLLIQILVRNGIVYDLDRDKPHDLGGLGRPCKKREADLPARGVVAELVEEVKGLALEFLARGWVPGDLNRVLDLYAEVVSQIPF